MTKRSSPDATRKLLRCALHCGWHALAFGTTLTLAACGPRGASPIPQPPVLAVPLDHIRIDEPDPGGFSPLPVHGKPGSAPAGALLRLTNLDEKDPPSTSIVAADGSFTSSLLANPGDELRFDFEVDGRRSQPTDAIFLTAGSGVNLMAAPSFACLSLSPGFILPFSADGALPLSVANACGAPVTLANDRARLGLPDFSLQTTLPLDVESGAVGTIDVAFARSTPGEREDVLFADVTLGAQTLRYPITLTAAP